MPTLPYEAQTSERENRWLAIGAAKAAQHEYDGSQIRVLEGLKVPLQKDFKLSGEQIVWGHAQQSPNAVILQTGDEKSGLVPNVIGMGAKDAVYLLESKGLRVQLYGIGKVRSQSIASGHRIVKGQTVTLQLKQ